MKTIATQQEILLLTGTKFSSREWAEKNVEDKNKLSATERIEDACWNGLLDELLPEIMHLPFTQKLIMMLCSIAHRVLEEIILPTSRSWGCAHSRKCPRGLGTSLPVVLGQ